MWKEFYEFVRQVISLTRKVEENQTEITELRQEVKELSSTVKELRDVLQRVVFEMGRVSENERHEREKMALRLENELLKFERRLPSGEDQK